MNENTRCFVLTANGYEEITYTILQERRTIELDYQNKRFIALHGMLMEVTEADYHDFYRNIRRQKYLAEEAIRNGAFSYHALDNGEFSGEDIIPDNLLPVDEQVSDKLVLEDMLQCLSRLDESDRKLIIALYFDGKTETSVAETLGISQQAVSKRHIKIIRKLKEIMKI